MATKFEEAFERMTPEQRKKATEQIGEMMGMPPRKKKPVPDYNPEEDEKKGLERYVD